MAGAGVRLLDGARRAVVPLAVLLCLRPAVAAGGATKYVVHYMPWFLGPDSGHWCNADWGNSFYDSVLGRYDVMDIFTVRRQLLLMKAAGIDGLWFDFQLESWIPRIQAIADEALDIGLNFAVMADNYMDENVTNSLREAIAGFMAMPNYYWVDGRPLLPVFEAPSRWQSRDTVLPTWQVNGSSPFIVGTYHWHQRESVPLPDGYDSLFFWISTDLIWAARYHQSTRFSLKVGSVYRGWREAYKTWHHSPPYLGFLNSTLQIIQDNAPDFAQIVTWNDYTEGTMLEPSFVRGSGGCLDSSDAYWVTMNATCNKQQRTLDPCLPGLWAPCSGSGEELCSTVQDCSKPHAAVEGPGVAGCPNERPGGGPLSAYYDLAMIANTILGTPVGEAIATFRSIVEVDRPTTATSTSTGTSATSTTTTGTTTTDGSFKHFEPEVVGADLACRGSSATDSSEAYYTLTFGVDVLSECQALCLQEAHCTGVEFNGQQGRCEVWTAPIGVKVERGGFSCLLRQDDLAEAATTTAAPTITTSASAAATWESATSTMAAAAGTGTAASSAPATETSTEMVGAASTSPPATSTAPAGDEVAVTTSTADAATTTWTMTAVATTVTTSWLSSAWTNATVELPDTFATASATTTTSTATSATIATRTMSTIPTTVTTTTTTTARATATTRTTVTTLTTTVTTSNGSATSTTKTMNGTSSESSLGPTTIRSTTALTTTTSTATSTIITTRSISTIPITTTTITTTTPRTTATTRTTVTTLTTTVTTSNGSATSTTKTMKGTSTESSLGPTTIRSTTVLATQPPTSTATDAAVAVPPSDVLSTTPAVRVVKDGSQPGQGRDGSDTTRGQATTSTPPLAPATSAAPAEGEAATSTSPPATSAAPAGGEATSAAPGAENEDLQPSTSGRAAELDGRTYVTASAWRWNSPGCTAILLLPLLASIPVPSELE